MRQVAWSLAAGSNAQEQSLVQAGQHVMGLPSMGRRQLKRKKSSCVVGQNVGPLVKTAKALVPCVDKAGSGFGGQSCPTAIKNIAHGCANSVFGSTLAKNCPRSCGQCTGGKFARHTHNL